jgi:hypothetical protein
MGAPNRRVNQQVFGHWERPVLEVVPQVAPHSPAFPAADAGRDGIPAAKRRGHSAPGNTRPGHL